MEEQPDQFQERLQDQNVILWGEVATFEVTVSATSPEEARQEEWEVQLGLAIDELISAIREDTEETLGPQFEVRITEIRRGSITVWIVLTALWNVYIGLAHLPDFIKAIDMLRDRITGRFRETIDAMPNQSAGSLQVESPWTPGPALLQAQQSLSFQKSIGQLRASINRLRIWLLAVAVANLLLLAGVVLYVAVSA